MDMKTKEAQPQEERSNLAVIYARYSSHAQGEQSIEGQLSQAYKYAAAHGLTVIREYVDRAKTGRTDKREAFQQMLSDAEKKQFGVILVWKVDRIGRNREEVAINKMRCRKNGVRFEYVAETIPDAPEGVILESMLEGLAEYYSKQLSQNIRRGIEQSADKCQVTGGNRPLGYKTGPNKEFLIDEETAPTVRQIFELYAAGVPAAEILRRLNEQGLRTLRGNPFNKNSLNSILKNEKYIGIYNNHGRHTPGGVPRIVDDETFYKVQEMLKINKRAPSNKWARADYLLTDKLFCGKCGAPMVGESGTSHTGAKHNYYLCSNKKRFKSCDKKAVRQADVEGAVLDAICRLLDDDDLLDQIIDKTWEIYETESDKSEERERLRRQAKATDAAISNLLRAIENGLPVTDEITARMNELTEQKQELLAAAADLELSTVHLKKEHIAFFLYNLRKGDRSDPAFCKQLIRTFVNAIFLFDDHFTITFNCSDHRTETITLADLQSAESGSGFVNRLSCSTKTGTYELAWFAHVFVLAIDTPWK